MPKQTTGCVGEDLVAKWGGYERKRGSGSRWPHKEDLENEKDLVQVKTTTAVQFLQDYHALQDHAEEIGKDPRYFQVVLSPRFAAIFEITLVDLVERGIGGDD